MSLPVKTHRRTKIVATVGPGCDSEDMLGRLINGGVDVFRLNFSHGSIEHHTQVAERIRRQSRHAGRYVGILADLQGPKIRISGFKAGAVQLTAGDPFCLDIALDSEQGNNWRVGVEYQALPQQVVVDDILLLDDGKLRLRVDDVSETAVDCTVRGGWPAKLLAKGRE